MSNSDQKSSRKIPTLWLYIGFGAVMLVVLVWTSIRTLRESPARQTSVELPAWGWLTFTLMSDPFPAVASVPVEFNVRVENQRSILINIGAGLPFKAGAKGSETVLSQGTVQFSPDQGRYYGVISFPAPGDYWLEFGLDSGKTARFQIFVEPAQ